MAQSTPSVVLRSTAKKTSVAVVQSSAPHAVRTVLVVRLPNFRHVDICSSTSVIVNKRSIGYYETWANTRPCSAVAPEQLNLQGLTHINFAFMFFEPDTFELTPMDKNAGSLLSSFTKLKQRKPGLETWVSVGGWSFNDRKLPYSCSYRSMLI